MKKALVALSVSLMPLLAHAEAQPWDALRPISNFAEEINEPVKWIVFLLALGIFVVSLLAYSRSKSKRMLLVSFAFFLFSLKWLIQVMDLFISPGNFLSEASENIFELGIMLSLFGALFYRKSWNRIFEKEPKD